VVLAVLKIVVDLHGHLRERPASTAPPTTVPQRTTSAGVLGLFGVFLVLCGVVLTAGAEAQAYRASRVKTHWPSTEAQVLECRVHETYSSRSREVSLELRCKFSYIVTGTEYVTTFTTHNTRDPKVIARMHHFVARHRSGSGQRIHYNPVAPKTISLGEYGEAIDPPLTNETLRAAGGFGAAGALLWLFALWKSRRSSGLRSSW
jgi:hypothetical protein